MIDFSRRRTWTALLVAAVVATLVCVSGCDPSVDVLNPSEQYQYSLFGVLNVAADTQVVRVEPLGDSTQIGAPPDIPATVFLENLDTGTRVQLRDSFDTVGGGIAQVHNFWTTHPIDLGTSYRIVVQEEGTPITTATTTTPAESPTLLHNPEATDDKPFFLPCELDGDNNPIERLNTFSLRVRNVEEIAAVKVRYAVTSEAVEGSVVHAFDHLDGASYEEDRRRFRVSVFYGSDLLSLSPTPNACVGRSDLARPYASVIVGAGGADWPEWRGASLDELARPDTFSNVEGGHGFVGGVYTDTIRVPIRSRD